MEHSSQQGEAKEVAELKAKVSSLERQLKRQKHARKNAEWFLESYSNDAYLANQALRKALHDSKKRERELLYLNRSASQLTQSDSGSGFIFSALKSAVEFTDAYCGIVLITSPGKEPEIADNKVWTHDEGWIGAPDMVSTILEALPLSYCDDYSHWCVSAIDNPRIEQEVRLLHFMQKLGKDENAWLALVTKDDHLDEEMLHILDTTKHYLQFGLGYQSTKHEVRHQKAALSSMQENQAHLQEKLVSADKMAMLGQLAAGIAHEINNPIGYVRSNTSVAKDIFKDYQSALGDIQGLCEQAGGDILARFREFEDRYSLNESAEAIAEMFEESSEGIERIVEIVKALRSFSYPSSGKRSAVSLVEAVNSAVKLTANLHKYKNSVNFIAPSHDVQVLGNAGQIQQVLVNLLTNAIYATPEGKSIFIRLDETDTLAILSVEDQGHGMSKDVIDKMFTPFFTTKPPGDGTGLGMSISLTIIEEHEGEIEVVSQENQGTTVSVSLKRA